MSNLNVPYILSTADYVILVILDHSCSFIGFNSFDPYIICQFCTDKLKQAVIDLVVNNYIGFRQSELPALMFVHFYWSDFWFIPVCNSAKTWQRKKSMEMKFKVRPGLLYLPVFITAVNVCNYTRVYVTC